MLAQAIQGALSQAMPFAANLFCIFIVGIMIFLLIRDKFLHRKVSRSDALPYTSREVLFTPAELNFLSTLEQSLNTNYRIYGKVRLCDIIEPKKNLGGKGFQRAFNRICSKHVDFVICNARSLAIEMVIELDDSTHEQRDRKTRDEFLNAALEAAHVPIARFPVKRAYTLRELQAKLGGLVVATQEPTATIAAQAKESSRCAACGSDMKLREKKSGDEAGRKFWVCVRYPECRSVEAYLEANKV